MLGLLERADEGHGLFQGKTPSVRGSADPAVEWTAVFTNLEETAAERSFNFVRVRPKAVGTGENHALMSRRIGALAG